MDNDPAAVRITKANAKVNACRRITTAKGSVLEWKTKQPLHLITANLFSELLIQASPNISRALTKDGKLIFSGVLKSQYSEVHAALEKRGFEISKVIEKGKWCAGLAIKSRQASK